MAVSIESTNSLSFLVSLCFSFLCILWFPVSIVLPLVIVLGQGHFVLAYWYQWEGGKVGVRYLFSYVLVASLLLGAYFFVPYPEQWLVVLSGALFAAHFFVDEMFIARGAWDVGAYLLLSSFSVLYTALLVLSSYGIRTPAFVILLCLVLLIPLIVRRATARNFSLFEVLMIVTCIILSLLLTALSSREISVITILAFVVLSHYMRWYLFYFVKLVSFQKPAILTTYVKRVIGINVILSLLFLIFFFVPGTPLLGLIFTPTAFYMWTTLHIVFSIPWFHAPRV